MLRRRTGSVFFVVLLWWVVSAGALAQGKTGSLASGAHQGWSASNEVTLSGEISSIAAKSRPGALPGLNFAMSGSQHALTVNAGANLSEEIRRLIYPGEPVQVTGVMRTVNGQDYLLARELVVEGRTIHVRSRSGFPVRQMGAGDPHSRTVKSDLKGGAR